MKINYVGYFDPYRYSGGGEMVLHALLDAGKRRGHEISLTTVRGRRNDYDSSADLDFLADVFNYPGTFKSLGAWRGFRSGLLENIAYNRPFIHFNNAYTDVCDLGYLPCSGLSTKRCPYKSVTCIRRNIVARDFVTKCFGKKELTREMFSHSILNVFVSPLHMRVCYDILGLTTHHPYYIVKPIIDGGIFFSRQLKRDIDYLFVGVICEAKGLIAMRERFVGEDIHFVGKFAPDVRLDFGTHHGHVAYERVPEFMNRARNFVFLPRWPEPQGRVVVEAALCGCNLITNANVGATSFPFDIGNSVNFSNSADEFWETIEQLPIGRTLAPR